MFPITIKGFLKIYVKDTDFFIKEFNEQVESEFSNEKGLLLTKSENEFIIKGEPLRFAWKGFNLLNGTSVLKMSIKNENGYLKVNYRFYFWEAFVIAVLFSIIPVFTSSNLIFHFQNYDYNVQLWFIFIIWGLLYFGNILVSFTRFYFFLRKRVKAILQDEKDYLLDTKFNQIRELNQKLSSSEKKEFNYNKTKV